ncbi:RagB/SusD family nutrient uptake outer membrane protein [Labilibaculum filiforme]|uniref:RagB/SusD family nutrient uptake outer membrane protein n=1 Tax=Labilibaculum filiforme TaxID=1940526 RepID=A0A2N3I205_9BACT|nr:RagB/SusD family nutrient uptake outer membrane protein [Labilibaculum filiforme]PKQ64283.1 RagB/SusD family nutrient uptake outer membrane protein [Labilibaculum filiforme]
MKIKILKYLAAASILLSFSSCDDFLTEVNPNEISTASYWNNLSDCSKGLTAVYNQFRNPGLMSVAEETKRTDLSFPGWGRPNTSDEYYLQIFTASSSGANNKWDNLYKGIFRANEVIAGLNGIESAMKTEAELEEWTVQMGQARFFRGLFYFYLHSSFNNGNVILYDFVPEGEADFNQPLTDASVIREFFTADLEYARKNLPETWTTYSDSGAADNDSNLGRVTSGAATTVLGKSYLYAKDYTSAALLFKEVIDGGNYQLVDVADNFTTQGEWNQESILEIAYNANTKVEESEWSAEGTSNTYHMQFSPVGGWRSVYPSNWLLMAYMEDPMDPTDPRNIVTEEDGTERLRVFSLRTSYSVALVEDKDMTYYEGSVTADGTAFNNSECGYWRKMTNWDILNTEKTTNQKSGINFRVIRYADVLLMYAECLIKGGTNDGGVTEALKYINKVRYRSALKLLGTSASSEYSSSTHDEVSYTAQSLMDHLMYQERPLELSAEGYAIRQLDMRRWGITKSRFEDLSNRYYKRTDYTFYSDIQNKEVTRWGGLLQHATLEDYDYKSMDLVQAAKNYNEAKHSYWPIPTSETTANSEVN